MANSVLCVKCGKWIHGRCVKVKRVTWRLGRDFVCGRCKKQADGLVEPVEELCKEVETLPCTEGFECGRTRGVMFKRHVAVTESSPTYELSKYLTAILKPLTDESRHKLQSTENCIDAIKTVQVPDDHKLVSFDVKSVFTSIPLQLALDCTETRHQQLHLQLPVLTNDLMDLLNLCLASTYFQYNGKHYKKLHGTAMGSPVSVVVAKIVMQNIEEQALASYKRTTPLWLRHVDDTFTTLHDFHEHLHKQNAHIQFTKEIEDSGKIAFLDC
ncbi:uncharacterized protein [Montipora capricornis]|uniref:uncharacterized protein n=1 Tax=Montipora capricornis TaxID=246305 RepID=UPI0035F2149F